LASVELEQRSLLPIDVRRACLRLLPLGPF